MVVKDLYMSICAELKEISPDTWSFEAFELLDCIAGVGRNNYPVYVDREVTLQEQEKAHELLARRRNGEPLQYILGQWEFYGLPFKVGKGVLIPRADTETIADTAINFANKRKYEIIADLCSGSGALAISIAENTSAKKVYAVEISPQAYSYLTENISMNNADRVIPLNEDIFSWQGEMLDMAVSNPPYIPTADMEGLDIEVKREPVLALDGGQDGLDFYRRISLEYYPRIKSGGALIFEVGIHQSDDVMNIMRDIGYIDINYKEDLCNIPRCVYGFKK